MRVITAALAVSSASAFTSPLFTTPRALAPRARATAPAMGKDAPVIISDFRGPTTDLPQELDPVGGRNLFLNEEDPKARICYDAFYAPEGGESISLLFLPYLLTPKNQGIAASLEAHCRRKGYTYICADYYGVGRSGGTPEDGCVSRWVRDTIQLLERVADGKTVLVGAAVGSWVMLRVAMERPDLVSAIVGLSPDADFTEELLMAQLSDEQKKKIMDEGLATITWGNTDYVVSRNLIEDGKKNLVLQGGKDSLNINCPVRLLHGTDDEEVPFDNSIRIMEAVQTKDVMLTLVKGANHFMEREEDTTELIVSVESAVAACQLLEYDLTSPGSG